MLNFYHTNKMNICKLLYFILLKIIFSIEIGELIIKIKMSSNFNIKKYVYFKFS